jgi:alkylation response protein AidB-like acyl-CoA dehydrogenase
VSREAAVACAKSAIQVLGGIGFTWEHDAHRYLRRAVAIRAALDVMPWRREVARLALSGVRRSRETVLPDEAESHRKAVRAFLVELDRLPAEEVRRAVADAGYLVPEWPQPWGRSASPAEQVIIHEEFRKAGVRRPDLHVGMWALPTLIAHGTPEQQDKWIRPTLVGDVTWCQLFSEPEAGSDLASLATKASRVEGGWRLTGQKVWTSLADTADVGLALARTSATDPPHAGITCFVVDMRAAGVEVRPLRELTGHPSFNEVFLTDVFVPDEDVVGDVDDGWTVGRTTLANERVTMGRGSSLGRGVEGLVKLLDASPELVSDAGVLDEVGQLIAEAQALGVLGHRVALRALAGGAPGPEASVRKLLSAEHDQRVEELGLRLLGPEGATQDGSARAWSAGFLMTRCLTIVGGTSEIQRNVLAERLLLLPRDV